MKVPAKVEKKYITKNGVAVLNILLHAAEDTMIKAHQIIRISPQDLESFEVLDPSPHVIPYYAAQA